MLRQEDKIKYRTIFAANMSILHQYRRDHHRYFYEILTQWDFINNMLTKLFKAKTKPLKPGKDNTKSKLLDDQ